MLTWFTFFIILVGKYKYFPFSTRILYHYIISATHMRKKNWHWSVLLSSEHHQLYPTIFNAMDVLYEYCVSDIDFCFLVLQLLFLLNIILLPVMFVQCEDQHDQNTHDIFIRVLWNGTNREVRYDHPPHKCNPHKRQLLTIDLCQQRFQMTDALLTSTRSRTPQTNGMQRPAIEKHTQNYSHQ